MPEHDSEQTAKGSAFDHIAHDYDQDFTETPIARWLRARVHNRLDTHFAPGASVLEMGCGTGEDALHLVKRGVQVTATDVSASMLDVARAKLSDYALGNVALLDLSRLPDDQFMGPFDGVYSNFGALNCLPAWKPLAAWLATRVKPGGILAVSVMGPFCPWEIGWHVLHGNFRTAFRRFRKSVTFQFGDSDEVTVRYPSPRHLQGEFAPWFRQADLRGLGVFLPPTDIFGVVEKRPRLLKILTRLEARFAQRMAWFGDHYWLELERLP